jgi:hypothetical protein
VVAPKQVQQDDNPISSLELIETIQQGTKRTKPSLLCMDVSLARYMKSNHRRCTHPPARARHFALKPPVHLSSPIVSFHHPTHHQTSYRYATTKQWNLILGPRPHPSRRPTLVRGTPTLTRGLCNTLLHAPRILRDALWCLLLHVAELVAERLKIGA